ncbi:diacylglycerol kinase family protein [Streptomyces purpureus]|uniref:Diacylglycerol kinase n=1 Tax=Streptomyces purpureus TaxID=1951 RepID=A0A918H7B1_9ACTN|nr:diacylglycerol kinase family protein [Streptomyces purpureus]GGT38842.1 diacylglycerol kinase [Streptomyces purpureus]
MSAPDQLLVVIDPVARRSDGESVRIAKDVLSAGSSAKICFPDGPQEYARALARRGSRRPVVIGDDGSLLRMVTLLHRERELSAGALSMVPVGAAGSLEIARSLGVPMGAVAAARTVLEGSARRLDLLVDESDGVVVGGLRIPATTGSPGSSSDHPPSVWDTCRSLVRTLVRPTPVLAAVRTHRLRVEADGVLLSDVDKPVEAVSVRSTSGRAEVVVRPPAGSPLRAVATAVTVSGPDFRYRADTVLSGPVRRRTWTVRPEAWGLTLPRG